MKGEVVNSNAYYSPITIIRVGSLLNRYNMFHSSSYSKFHRLNELENKYKIESLMMKNEDITSRYISLANKVESIREFIIESLNED